MNPVLGLTVADTLRCDSLSLVEWKSQSDYDYSRELVTPDFNLMQWITEKVQRFSILLYSAGEESVSTAFCTSGSSSRLPSMQPWR